MNRADLAELALEYLDKVSAFARRLTSNAADARAKLAGARYRYAIARDELARAGGLPLTPP